MDDTGKPGHNMRTPLGWAKSAIMGHWPVNDGDICALECVFANAMSQAREEELHRRAQPDSGILAEIAAEVARARALFPGSEFRLAALVEEVGELANAMLEHRLGKDTLEHIREEAVQVAAMAIRIAEEGDSTFVQEATDG